jgi:hypothetical protein
MSEESNEWRIARLEQEVARLESWGKEVQKSLIKTMWENGRTRGILLQKCKELSDQTAGVWRFISDCPAFGDKSDRQVIRDQVARYESHSDAMAKEINDLESQLPPPPGEQPGQ